MVQMARRGSCIFIRTRFATVWLSSKLRDLDTALRSSSTSNSRVVTKCGGHSSGQHCGGAAGCASSESKNEQKKDKPSQLIDVKRVFNWGAQ